jgi:hypothetical protein
MGMGLIVHGVTEAIRNYLLAGARLRALPHPGFWYAAADVADE